MEAKLSWIRFMDQTFCILDKAIDGLNITFVHIGRGRVKSAALHCRHEQEPRKQRRLAKLVELTD